jgi:hypothetical protein
MRASTQRLQGEKHVDFWQVSRMNRVRGLVGRGRTGEAAVLGEFTE